MKLHKYLICQYLRSSFYIYFSSFCSNASILEYYKRVNSIFQSFFFGGLFGYNNGFRILGRGYKAYVHLNNYIFRLGYSHNVYYVLPLLFKSSMKDKTKNFWMIRGTNNVALSNIISMVRNFKIPNTYRFKGIYKLNDSYRIKLTKKGGTL
jgi:large subunit ribosomal protein L6